MAQDSSQKGEGSGDLDATQGVETPAQAQSHTPLLDTPDSGSGAAGSAPSEQRAGEDAASSDQAPPANEPATGQDSQIVYCSRCGAMMQATDRFCHTCGWEVGATEAPRIRTPVVNPSDRNRLTTLLLCLFLGVFGAHRFYVGKTGTGLLWLFTLGFLGIGVVYDIIFIALAFMVFDYVVEE